MPGFQQRPGLCDELLAAHEPITKEACEPVPHGWACAYVPHNPQNGCFLESPFREPDAFRLAWRILYGINNLAIWFSLEPQKRNGYLKKCHTRVKSNGATGSLQLGRAEGSCSPMIPMHFKGVQLPEARGNHFNSWVFQPNRHPPGPF